MQKSSSEPVLRDSDYYVPCNGVGLTGHPKRMTGGAFLKDKGEHSSRINQIVKLAEKVPGAGKYDVGMRPWSDGRTSGTRMADESVKGFGNQFPTCGREFKLMNKNVAPGYYDAKDIMDNVANAGRPNLSQNPRVILGKFPKGPRRSFLESAIRASAGLPGPDYDTHLCQSKNKLKTHEFCPDFASSAKRTRGLPVDRGRDVGPNHYYINHKHTEERATEIGFTKSAPLNFLDKYVREKLVDLKTRKELPGPGTYPVLSTEADYKVSRGTKLAQLRGIGRSPLSGYL